MSQLVVPTPVNLAAIAAEKKARVASEMRANRLRKQAGLARRAGNPRLAGELNRLARAC